MYKYSIIVKVDTPSSATLPDINASDYDSYSLTMGGVVTPVTATNIDEGISIQLPAMSAESNGSDYTISGTNANGTEVVAAGKIYVTVSSDTSSIAEIQNDLAKKADLSGATFTGPVTAPVRDNGGQVYNMVNAGADPGGATDSTSAINTGLSTAAALGRRAFASGTFAISDTITIPDGVNVDFSDAVFNYSGTGTAIQIGNTGDATFRQTVHCPQVVATAKTASGWEQVAGSVGVDVVNCYACVVTIPRVRNFETGLRVHGVSGGTQQCAFHLVHLDNNKVNIRLTGDAAGWANQNYFFGGRCTHDSNEGTDVAGTRHVLFENLSHAINGNQFFGTSLESPDVVEYNIEAANALRNAFWGSRFETTTESDNTHRRVLSSGNAKGNMLVNGSYADTVVQTVVSPALPFDIDTNSYTTRHGGTTTTPTMVLENVTSNTNAIMAFMPAGAGKAGDDPNTAYAAQFGANQLVGKRSTDSHARFIADFQNGRLYLGDATADPVGYLRGTASTVAVGGGVPFVPLTSAAQDLGVASLAWRNAYFSGNVNAPGLPNVFIPTSGDQTGRLQTFLDGLAPGTNAAITGTVNFTTVTMSVPDVHLSLVPGAVLNKTSAFTDGIVVNAEGVTIAGGKIVCPAAWDGTNTAWTYAVIRSVENVADNLTVDHVTFENIPKIGIGLRTNDAQVTNCRFYGNYPASQWTGVETAHFAVYMDPSAQGTQGGCVVAGNQVRTCVQGVGIGNFGAGTGYGYVIDGNTFYGMHNHGIYNNSGVASSITGNTFYYCQIPIVTSTASQTITGNTIFASTTVVDERNYVGIQLREAINCIVEANTLTGQVGAHIGIDVVCLTGTELRGNLIKNNTINFGLSGGDNPAIRLGAGAQVCVDNQIEGNIITGGGSATTPSAAMGQIQLVMAAGYTGDRNSVSGNQLTTRSGTNGISVNNQTRARIHRNTVGLEWDAPSVTTIIQIRVNSVTDSVIDDNIFACTADWGNNIGLRGIQEDASCSGNVFARSHVRCSTVKLTAMTEIVQSAPTNTSIVGVQVGELAAATSPGTVVKKVQIFDGKGSSLGFIPVYDSIS